MAERRGGAARGETRTTEAETPAAGSTGPLADFDLEQHIFYLFGQAYGRRNRQLADIFHEYGLTNPKYRVLAALTNRDGCPIGTLAKLTAVERTTLSRALDQLVADKLVKRVPRAGDKRTIEVWMTAEGWRTLERVWPLIVAQNERAVAGLSDSEIETLKAILRKMIDNLRDDDR
ncbi:MAG: MarR family winged helix-turn-helix transcriptional regulator [Bauldia litoralis]